MESLQYEADLPPSSEEKLKSKDFIEEISRGECIKDGHQLEADISCVMECFKITRDICAYEDQNVMQNDVSECLSMSNEVGTPTTYTPDANVSKTVIGDGSDSGCCCAGHVSSLQRALSSNSGGLEDTTPAVSCDSSLISCYSSYEDTEDLGTSTTVLLLHRGDGTSEGGSESSSVTDKDLEQRNKTASTKRSTNTSTLRKRNDTTKTDTPRTKTVQVPHSRTTVLRQQVSATHRNVGQGALAGRRREKTGAVTSSLTSGTGLNVVKPLASVTKPSSRLTSARTRSKATSDAGTVKNEAGTVNLKSRNNAKTVSSARNKTEVSDVSDDGLWSTLSNKSNVSVTRSRGGSLVESQSKRPILCSLSSNGSNGIVIESKANALEKYATLPRRRRHQSPDGVSVSQSVSRDLSLNRAASLRKQHHQRDKEMCKALPPYPRRKLQGRKTVLRETSVQTATTEHSPIKIINTLDQEIQVSQECQEIEHLATQLKLLQANCDHQKKELYSVKEELDSRNKRVLALLGNGGEKGEGVDSLQELEMQLQSSDSTLNQQQQKISDLKTQCHSLKLDLEKSLAAQKSLLQEQHEIEAESIELQEFLLAEKISLAETLQEAEAEIGRLKQQLVQREAGLQQQQEECKHLVRISEQRRQESLAFQARLGSLEKRSKELLLQQGAAVSGAAVALSGLASRLDRLVEQLVSSYDISEKDLEDVIFHNEAYSKSNSSVEASPEKTSCDQPLNGTVPKPGASFVTSVISAIKNAAAQSPFSSVTEKKEEESVQLASTEMDELSECVKNICTVPPDGVNSSHLANSKSLHNLSQAILIRQQSEIASCPSDKSEVLSPVLEDYCSAATLVDQIIDIDNLVTKLLKVLRILQLENETCVGELNDERTQLAEQVRREQTTTLWDW